MGKEYIIMSLTMQAISIIQILKNINSSILKRFLFAIACVCLVLGTASYFSEPVILFINKLFKNAFQNPYPDISFTFLGIALLAIMLLYLQSNLTDELLLEIAKQPGNAERDNLRQLKNKFDTLEKRFDEFYSKSIFSKEDKDEIKDGIIQISTQDFITDIFKSNTDALKDEITNYLGLQKINNSFLITIERIKNEIRRLSLRANINLIIGVGISFFGIYVLGKGIDVFNDHSFLTFINVEGQTVSKPIDEILIQVLPRISFVFIVELFAYFFLKLYKNGLDEIKYFHNELTNIESKLVTVEVAYITKNEIAMQKALDVLVSTERNFILKKDETTVELQKARSDSENIQNIMKAIPELFKNRKP